MTDWGLLLRVFITESLLDEESEKEVSCETEMVR